MYEGNQRSMLSKSPRLFVPCIAFPGLGNIYKLNFAPNAFRGVQALGTDCPKQQ